ncbi:MAG: hypothetical protein J6R79_00605 [Bacteroidaceae bacterium]|nr:hypothetical protein [Bacteroidaceae bacterium]
MSKYFNLFALILALMGTTLFYSCSEDDDFEIVDQTENQLKPLDIPCSITIDLSETGNSRLGFNFDGNSLKSTWSEGDQFEIYKNGVCYTFTLDDACDGSAVGTFTSPTTPPKNDEYGTLNWYVDNFNYEVFFPSKDGYNNISFANQVQDGDGDTRHLKDKITMSHMVGHYTDIRFDNKDYTTLVTFTGVSGTIPTYGSNFSKNTIIQINASNLPEDFQPTSLTLENYSNTGANIIIPFLTHNAQSTYNEEHSKMDMTLQNFDKDKSFVAYMAQAVHQKSFPAGTVLRLTIKDSQGEIYIAEKVIESAKTVSGGKMIVLNFANGWKKGNNPNYVSTDKSKDGTYVQLQAASVPNGINIVFMGDGYSDRQIADGTYDQVMKSGYDAFFSEEPFTSFKNYFNVYYVVAVSDTEGCSDAAVVGMPNNSVFKTYFGPGTHVAGNNETVLTYTQKIPALASIDRHRLTSIVMMNSTKYAGTCHMSYSNADPSDYGLGYAVSYFPVGKNYELLRQVLTHEANGHGFGKLADEYSSGGNSSCTANNLKNTFNPRGWHLNIDTESNPSLTIWSEFYTGDYITKEGIGAYAGAYTWPESNDPVFYRPTSNSIMRYNTGGFNAPSRKAIYVRIHKMVYGEAWSWSENKEDFLTWDKNNVSSIMSTSPYVRSVSEENFVPLAPPVIIFE